MKPLGCFLTFARIDFWHVTFSIELSTPSQKWAIGKWHTVNFFVIGNSEECTNSNNQKKIPISFSWFGCSTIVKKNSTFFFYIINFWIDLYNALQVLGLQIFQFYKRHMHIYVTRECDVLFIQLHHPFVTNQPPSLQYPLLVVHFFFSGASLDIYIYIYIHIFIYYFSKSPNVM